MKRVFGVPIVVLVLSATFSAATPALDLTAGSGAVHNCPQSSHAIAFNAAAIAYLEPAPVVTIDDYGGGRYAPSRGNDIGIGIGYTELTGEAAGFCIGALYRAEYRAEASRDTLDALVANHFGHPFDAGRTYRLSMTQNSLKAAGLRVRRVADFELSDNWSIKIGGGASLLKPTEGRHKSLEGMVTATSASYAIGKAALLETASDLNLANFNPFVAAGSPSGIGYSTDFEVIVQSKGGSSIDFIAMDALGRLYWHDVPNSFKTLNNSTISYNANFDRDAFVTGFDSRIHFVQHLIPKYQLALSTPVTSRLSAFVEDDFVGGFHFPSFGARCGTGNRMGEVNYDIRTKAVGVGGRLRWIRALVTTNDIRLRNASVLGISIQSSYSW